MSSPSSGGQPPANTLHDRYQKIREQIRLAAEKSHRPESSIRLMAVTKTVSADRIQEALDLGVSLLGENRVQEAAGKIPGFKKGSAQAGLQFHLIGGLQTNKARKAVELFDVIQSVDRLKLAQTLDRIASELGKKQRCFIEVKITDEPAKSGVPLSGAAELIKEFLGYKNLSLEGLMTIGKLNASPGETRRLFRMMNFFFNEHRTALGTNPVLSMGMSDDFEIAIEEGSSMVRIGRALFGERKAVIPAKAGIQSSNLFLNEGLKPGHRLPPV